MNNIAEKLIDAAQRLSKEAGQMVFSEPVTAVYNPLDYAWDAHELYLRRYGNSKKHVVFLGMNPGPWGMAQTGVPFGEIDAVKQWLGIEAQVKKPDPEHPRRPVTGFMCQRSEVSGRRLWGLFSQRFGDAAHFFTRYFVANYCPLVFMEESGRNRTPDRLTAIEKEGLFASCDRHLRELVQILEPQWLVGVGRFTESCARRALGDTSIQIGQILHPSPASPAANRDWAGTASKQLKELNIWHA